MTVSNEEGQDIEEVGPNFWPLPLYNIHFEGEAHVDMVRELKFKGNVIKGIYLEDDGRPLPAGRSKGLPRLLRGSHHSALLNHL